MRRLLKGETRREIAREMGMKEGSISRIVNDPVFQRVLFNVQERTEAKIGDFYRELGEVADQAVHTVKEILGSESAAPRLRFKVARWILDAAGVREKDRDPAIQN